MELELLNYKTSILNPALKWIAPVLFLIAFAMLVQAYNNYGGIFKQAMKVLLFTLGVGVRRDNDLPDRIPPYPLDKFVDLESVRG